MNRSPYEVLGVPTTATDDQIKAAYRKLAKQYHPDLNGGSAASEAKMKEINEAYNLLIKHKGEAQQQAYGGQSSQYAGGYGGGGYGGSYSSGGSGGYNNPFGGFDEFFRGSQQRERQQYTYTSTYTEMDSQLKRVEDALRDRNVTRARQVLNGISHHTAAWYYWCAMTDAMQGNRVSALNNARIAMEMDTRQPAFRSLYNQLQANGQAYQRAGNMQGFMGGLCNNSCLTCLAINLVCNCCCNSRFCC